jgi:ABC-type antimicrobial peptide transport system permease subunit
VARTSLPRDAVMLALFDLQPSLAIGGVGLTTLDDTLRLSLMLPRIVATTTIVFSLVTLALAVFGLYSTVFYAVSQRRMEMGIRATLGATPRDLFALVLREAGWRAGTGAAVGLALGFAVVPIASSVFYGIGTVEPTAIMGVALVSGLVVIATSYVVARPWMRRTAIDLLRR